MSVQRNQNTTTITENTYTCSSDADDRQMAQVTVRQINDEAPTVALSLNVPGRKRPVALALTVGDVEDLRAMLAAIVTDTGFYS